MCITAEADYNDDEDIALWQHQVNVSYTGLSGLQQANCMCKWDLVGVQDARRPLPKPQICLWNASSFVRLLETTWGAGLLA